MKSFVKIVILLGLFALLSTNSFADLDDFGFKPLRHKLDTKEELFQLYTRWLYADLDSTSRNILYLELAYTLPFDHPIKAIVPIETKLQHNKYKSLLMMHICVMLTKEYLNYGNLFMKERIYYFNREFFDVYLEGYDKAEFYYKSAKVYWKEAIQHAKVADSIKGVPMNRDFWRGWNFDFEEEVYRIKTGQIFYDEVLAKRFARVKKNRAFIKNLQKELEANR